MKRISVIIFFVTLVCATATAFAQKVPKRYVAVIETQIDERSGASADINKAEVAEITNEIRREAVNNLPRSRFHIMTTETVLSMGDAVLQECADENCVISLGSKIGADYIVRGVISKFRNNLTLTVEMYETEYGMLVATAAPVRTANLDELLAKTTVVCAEMYKKFLEATPAPTPTQPTAPLPQASAQELSAPPPAAEPTRESPTVAPGFVPNFTAGQRWGTFGLNLVLPGGGSAIIMKDWTGAIVTWSVVGGSAITLSLVGEVGNGGTRMLAGFGIGHISTALIWNPIRSITYDKKPPKTATASVPLDGFNVAFLPDQNGGWQGAVVYVRGF